MKALIIVDMQNDFMPGGSLGIPGADQAVPIINGLTRKFPLVVATQDWHPADHVSFSSNHPGKKVGDVIRVQGADQILWPVHCVRHTKGAQLVDTLNKEQIANTFYKGTDKEIDDYSDFFDNAHLKSTGLADYLKTRGVDEIYFAGVATDYCVLWSALDAIALGFTVYVIFDACRGINLKPGDEERALATMIAKGVRVIDSSEIFKSS